MIPFLKINFETIEKKIENALYKLNKNSDVHYSTLNMKIKPDSDININMKADDCEATLGLSYGLEGYYYYSPRDDLPEIEFSPYIEAIGYAQGKWIVTQMQAQRNKKFEEGKSTNYKRLLMNALNFVSSEMNLKVNLYLPAKLNFWMCPSAEFSYVPIRPDMSCLLMNYDYNAKRHKFKLNNVGLFERS